MSIVASTRAMWRSTWPVRRQHGFRGEERVRQGEWDQDWLV